MMAASERSRRGLIWAVIGGAVLLAGIAAIVVTALLSRPAPTPINTSPSSNSPAPSPSAPADDGTVVDDSVADRGWRPEPITTDAETYVQAALEAAATFDTTLSSRDDWLGYLDSWFTLDTRYASSEDQAQRREAAQLELRQGVVVPESEWDSMASEDGRVVALVDGDMVLSDVTDDTSGDMSIGTADVVLTFTRSDGSGNESSYDETVRVSVQVLCGPASVPTPGTAQQPGDCKVVRFFTEPMEP